MLLLAPTSRGSCTRWTRATAPSSGSTRPPPGDTSDAFLALPLATGDAFAWKQQIITGDVFVAAQTNGNPDGDFGANPILFDFGGRKLVSNGYVVFGSGLTYLQSTPGTKYCALAVR